MALTAQYYTAMSAGYVAARALGALYADDAVCGPPHALARPVCHYIDGAPSSLGQPWELRRRPRRCWCTRARGWQGEQPWLRTLRLWPSATRPMGVQPTTWMPRTRRRYRRGCCYPGLLCWKALLC